MALHVGGVEEEATAMSDINVTPLVDVMLVLLIIFIITIRVILQQVPLTLPKATNLTTHTSEPENITIAIDKQGAIYREYETAIGPRRIVGDAARHCAAGTAARKCIFAATRMFGINLWARCWWRPKDRYSQSRVTLSPSLDRPTSR